MINTGGGSLPSPITTYSRCLALLRLLFVTEYFAVLDDSAEHLGAETVGNIVEEWLEEGQVL